MNQSQLIQALADQTGESGTALNKTEVSRVLVALSGVVQHQLKAGEEVSLPGLGKLKALHKAAKTGRNPRTGEAVEIPAKTVAKFVPAKALTDAINGAV